MGCVITGLGTHVKVADIDKSRRFYESLGFIPVFAYGDEKWRASLPAGIPSAPERYRGMTFKVGNSAEYEIAEGHIAIRDAGVFREVVKSPKVTAMVRVESLVPLLANPLIKITFPIRHYYWGTIEAAFRDPDGFVLVFIAPYSDEERANVCRYVPVEDIRPGT